jgi:hypothetical protein
VKLLDNAPLPTARFGAILRYVTNARGHRERGRKTGRRRTALSRGVAVALVMTVTAGCGSGVTGDGAGADGIAPPVPVDMAMWKRFPVDAAVRPLVFPSGLIAEPPDGYTTDDAKLAAGSGAFNLPATPHHRRRLMATTSCQPPTLLPERVPMAPHLGIRSLRPTFRSVMPTS